ncbi:MAG: histidine kinase [Clostridia bacterium]|nr:histidine kinase [Clostridia bacterium]
MIDQITLINFAMGIAGMMLSSLGLILSIVFRPIERWTRSYFIATFFIMLICTVAITLDYYAAINQYTSLLKPLIFVESLTSSMLMPLLTVYMLKLCRESGRKSPLLFMVIGLWVVYLALLVYTQYTTVIYSVSADGVYSRGPLYPLLLVPPVAILLLNLAGLFQRRKKLPAKQRLALFVYMAAPLVSIIIQMFFYYGLLLASFGAIVGAYVMFIFIVSEQTDMAVRQAHENAEKEFGLKVLQMRPHFIYNVMTSIYYLVDTDPEAAKDAIRGFSKYLHRNFTAVVKTENVPFQEELAHTQAYLAVEKTRFGDRLDVSFDTPDTMFSLPPLTLESIVENAVKHGMDPDLDALHILIRTRSGEGGHEITVINDGTDFNLADLDGDGVGLKNVSERLARMCGGTLRIAPQLGGGAVVTLWIPHRAGNSQTR